MQDTQAARSRVIVRTGLISIAANILLSAFKAAIGLMTHSIAIVLDAVNNLSDAASGVITIVGTKLAGKKPDKKHPFGHGRIEYLTSMIIAALVLYAGITSLVESVKKIFAPETPDYSGAALVILAAAVVVKLLLGRYVGKTGKRIDCEALEASGKDALLDAVISASTLAAAGIYLLWHISLEAWLGGLISLVIIKSGAEMLGSTLSVILGERTDPRFAAAIKQTIRTFPEVEGAYDLILHDYGPGAHQGSVHIAVADTVTAPQLDTLTRHIYERVYAEHRVALTGVSIYSVNTNDPHTMEVMERIGKTVLAFDHVKQIHGFCLIEEEKSIRFDMVISFNARDWFAVFDNALAAAQALYPDYTLTVAMDTDFSEK